MLRAVEVGVSDSHVRVVWTMQREPSDARPLFLCRSLKHYESLETKGKQLRSAARSLQESKETLELAVA